MVTQHDQAQSKSWAGDYEHIIAQVREAHQILSASLGPEVLGNGDVNGNPATTSTAPADFAIVREQAALLARVVGELLLLVDTSRQDSSAPPGSSATDRAPAFMPAKGPETSSAAAPGGDGSTPLVLVVDDNQDAADMLASLVEHLGYEAMVAHDGASALRLVKARRPDVALLDIGLPGMDGYELAAHLRNEPTLKGLRILALTGHGLPKDRQRTAAAGFDAHLLKPLDAYALAKVLSET